MTRNDNDTNETERCERCDDELTPEGVWVQVDQWGSDGRVETEIECPHCGHPNTTIHHIDTGSEQ